MTAADLMARLETGWAMIEDMSPKHPDYRKYERFWESLLPQYEAATYAQNRAEIDEFNRTRNVPPETATWAKHLPPSSATSDGTRSSRTLDPPELPFSQSPLIRDSEIAR